MVPCAATTEGMSGTKSALVAGTVLRPPPAPAISRSDAAFAADGVEFVFGGDELDIDELNDLFEKVSRDSWQMWSSGCSPLHAIASIR